MTRGRKQSVTRRIPPENLEAEKALLGCMLLDQSAFDRAMESVRKEYFSAPSHRSIFEAMAKLSDSIRKCDLVTLTNELDMTGTLDTAGGVEYLSQIIETTPTAAHVDEYIRIVRDRYILRSLIENATEIINEASGEPDEVDAVLDRAERRIFAISEDKAAQDVVQIGPLVREAVNRIETNQPTGVTGVPTGFTDLDVKTTGFQPSNLIIIASRPSMGKTAFACNIALNLLSMKPPPGILIFSLEMSKEDLVQRMLCAEAKVNLMKVRQGLISDRERGELIMAGARLADAPIFIDDSANLNVFEVRARARRIKAKENIGLIIIDYLQLMRGRDKRYDNRQHEISEISAALKALAKELKVPVVAISQLSRAPEQRGENKRPELADLRESGAIEQDADLVLLLFREEFYKPDDAEVKGKAEIRIAKQRNGPTGTIPLVFLSEYTRFENATSRSP